MYIGAIKPKKVEVLMINDDGKFEYQEIEYVPAFLKIIDEIFSNAVDEGIRTGYKFANDIKVIIDNKSVKVIDNGRGVPQGLIDNTPQAVVAFTETKAGTNFVEETKAAGSIGLNGVGSVATNVFSKVFIVKTCDGSSTMTIDCRNNMEKIKWSTKPGRKKGTEVYFEPDLDRFSMMEITEVYVKLMEQQMFQLAQLFPIKFTLENKITKSAQPTSLF